VVTFVADNELRVAHIYVRLAGQRLAPPAFDEQKAADALGWSGELLLGITSATLLIVVAWLVVKLPNRWLSLPAILIGTVAGWALWMEPWDPFYSPDKRPLSTH
jgi:xanthine/uracil permease